MERQVCVVCASEVRRVLLSVPPTAQAKAQPEMHVLDPSRGVRFGWFVTRWTIYVAVAVAAFAIATWLAAR
ncbi:MAG TPA: hypothetical protein VFJ93_00160 [Gaiellaceae bacterium]|nr:hypothetical protein [Gaiellaceae bacterium]